MGSRIAAALVCAALVLQPSGVFADRNGIGIYIVGAISGDPIARGKTDEYGRWTAPKPLEAGMYTLQIGRQPAMENAKFAVITINIGGQENSVKTEKGLLIDRQGGREIIMTMPIPRGRFTYDFAIGSPMSPSEPRTFTVTVTVVNDPPT